MTNQYEAALRHVVTVCAADRAVKDPDIGLLFVDRTLDRKPSDEEVLAVLVNEDLKRVFGSSYWGGAVSWVVESGHAWLASDKPRQHGIFVSTSNTAFRAAGYVNQTYFLRYDRTIVRLTLDEVYNQCIRLVKLMGCERCKLEPHACVEANIPDALQLAWLQPVLQNDEQLTLDLIPVERTLPDKVAGRVFRKWYWELLNASTMDYDDWKERKYVNWKSSIAGHRVISPLATSTVAPMPTKAIRTFCHQDFSNIEEVRDALSARSSASMRTRNRIRKECAHCYFGRIGYNTTDPCDTHRVRWCEHGQWTEEGVVEYTIEKFERALEGTPFDLASTWRVARFCGMAFKKKHEDTGRPREWVLQRINRYRSPEGALEVLASRTARNVRGCDGASLKSPAEVRAFLPKDWHEKWDEDVPIDRNVLAMWIHLAITTHGPSYSYFYSSNDACGFQQVSPAVGWVGLLYGDVVRCLWLSRKERNHVFHSLRSIMRVYNDLLLFDIGKPEDEERPNLRACVR